MDDIMRRLDMVKAFIQEPEFLEGKGLSNEVNIRIFCYDPKDELIVEHFIRQIATDPTLNCNLIECDLYKIFLGCCEEIEILEAIPEMEAGDGCNYLLTELCSTIPVKEVVAKMQYFPHEPGDVLMLTGVGNVFPFVRVHSLLETLQPYFSDIPILVMYPGKFDGHDLRLFNRLAPNGYYRGFDVI